MPKVGRKRKKTRTHAVVDEKDSSALAKTVLPKSFVLQHGGDEHEAELSVLIADMRLLMSPYTALSLKESKGAKIRDYIDSAQHLGVTHLLAFSLNAGKAKKADKKADGESSEKQEKLQLTSGKLNLKIARLPTGPTLTFKVRQFSLGKQVRSLLRRPPDVTPGGGLFSHPPVVVTNNFGAAQDASTDPQTKLMRITFQNMFPAVDVGQIKLSHVRRVVLFDLKEGDKGAEEGSEEAEDRVEVRQAQKTTATRTVARTN